MGYRYYLCGSMRLSKAAWERAQTTTFLKMCFVDEDFDVTTRGVPARDLFAGKDGYQKWALNSYDEGKQRWNFGCSIHDDDWDNAETAPLPLALKKTKDLPGVDLVVVAHDWHWNISAAWTADIGKVVAMKKVPELVGAARDQLFAGEYAKALASLSKSLGLDASGPTRVKTKAK